MVNNLWIKWKYDFANECGKALVYEVGETKILKVFFHDIHSTEIRTHLQLLRQ